MTQDELIAVVAVHEHGGRPYFIRIGDIPEPWQSQFRRATYGAQQPVIDDEGSLAYAWDWLQWVGGTWYGGHNGPTNLEDAQTPC